MAFKKSFQEFIYSLSTQDKYAEFDSRKSFNRINKPKTETEANLLTHHGNGSSTFVSDYEEDDNFNKFQLDGVHEVRLAWRHIKNWVSKYSPDLNSSLQKPCTDDDVNDFQKDLNIRLPNCLVEFYKLTDGQHIDDFNKVGGLFFGLKLMSLDEISVMTEHWRKVAKTLTSEMSHRNNTDKVKQLPKMGNYKFSNSSADLVTGSGSMDSAVNLTATSSESSATNTTTSNATTVNETGSSKDKPSSKNESSKSGILNHYPSQRSIPPAQIHPIFAHPLWIPLITDDVGNCIGVDLAPPITGKGKWGQIILFGREFDTKYLIADNFGDFLLIFANDLEIGNWDIKEPEKNNYGDLMIGSEGDLIFVDKETKQELNYLTVLKQRCISKWINSLSDEELDDSTKQLIKDLKSNPDSILNVKTLNDNSIDNFINNNLNIVNGMLQPINLENSSAQPTGSVKRAGSVKPAGSVKRAGIPKPPVKEHEQTAKPTEPKPTTSDNLDHLDYTEDRTLDDVTI